MLSGVPALIDFNRSIVAEDTLSSHSPVKRGGNLWRRLSYAMRDVSGVQRAIDRRAASFLKAIREHVSGPATILNIGAATLNPSSPFNQTGNDRIITSDIYNSPSIDVLADGHFLPFRNATFDGVAAQAVLEHVLDPALVVAEMHRVLKPGGIVYAETSFMEQVHEGPFDFTRFTHSGHRWLFRKFDEIQSGASNGPGNALLWSIRYAVRGLFRTKLAGIAAMLALLWLRLVDKITPDAFSIDSTNAVFFIGRKNGHTLTPKEMIGYYRGAGRR